MQSQTHQQQQQGGHPQQQQQQPLHQQQQQPGPLPLPAAGQNGGPPGEPQMSLAGVLHYLQTEWRRWERDRNEWEIERAEMRARIALLEGERRSADNLKTDLSRRVKLLEFALRQERSKVSEKQSAPVPAKSSAIPPGKLSLMQAEAAEGKDGSASSEGGSDDGAVPNGVRASASPPPGVKEAVSRAGSVPPPTTNGNGPVPNWKTGVAAAGRDPKSRQRSRDYLKQCLQEVSYLTSPGALNPLPSRPIVLPSAAAAAAPGSPAATTAAPESLTYAQATSASPAPVPTAPSDALPTILLRPRKSLSDHPPPSPVQGIPTSIQESMEQEEAEESARAAAATREAEAKAAVAAKDQERLRHVEQKAAEMSEEEIREDTEARAIAPPDNEPAAAVTVDEASQQAVPEDAALEAAIDSVDEQAQTPPAADDDAADLSSDATVTAESPLDARLAQPLEADVVDDEAALAEEEEDASAALVADEIASNAAAGEGASSLDVEDEREEEEEEDENRLTAMFRPPDKAQWRDALSKAGSTIPSDDAAAPAPADVGRSPEEELANFTLDDTNDVDDEDDEDPPAVESTTSDAGSWKSRRTLKGHVDAVRDVACHPTELCVASASEDCTVKLWRLDLEELSSDKSTQAEQEPQITYRGHSSAVTCVVFSPSRDVVYSGSLDATIRAWKVPSASSHSLYSPHDESLSLGPLVGHTDGVWDLAVVGAEGERVLVSASADGSIKVWDAEQDSTPLLLSWGYDGLEKDDAEDAEESDEPKVVPTSVCAIGTDPSLVAVAYTNSIVKLFRVRSGKEVLKFESDESHDGTPATQINKIVSHPTRPTLFSAHEDKVIRLMDISSGESTLALPAHGDGVCALAVSPSLPDTLVSVGHDGSLRVWDLPSHASVQELALHRQNRDSGALGVAMHSKERVIVTGGADATVRVLTWSEGPSAGSQ